MSDEKTSAVRKDYFTACLLAIGTASAGLLNPGDGSSSGLVLLGIIAIIMVIGIYFFIGRSTEESEADEIPVSLPRLRRMALLWYALTVVLGISLVREPLRGIWTGGSADVFEWLLGVVGLVAIGLAVWRILRRSRR